MSAAEVESSALGDSALQEASKGTDNVKPRVAAAPGADAT
jgi:hypothetical protein